MKCLYQMLESRLNTYDVYKAAKDYPLSEAYKEEIRAGLEFEQPIPHLRRWTSEALQQAVPALYNKYCAHGYALVEM